jgi:hypothetical protein
MRQNLEQQSSS